MGYTISMNSILYKIAEERYLRVGNKTTVCCLILANGFEIIGTSACVDPKNFNLDIGKEYAREDAVKKLYELEAYLLQENLAGERQCLNYQLYKKERN